ncbi:hypothetical protein ONZ51_g222 [Trametes cubensis]|uniref:Uncharacterized protein n=1 Tax=Trametes cubensis TaxID=1111947 RepID=A0AAD7U4H3_9APHY|nr:hypothetical protein ONZ51_g222 [Trametes cubensis]
MSSADNFGTVVNAFSTVSMAFNAAQLARALWMRHCPNKARIDELRDIVTEWRKWRARLSPEERVYIEAHRPGFLDQMATELSIADQTIESLWGDYRDAVNSSWATYYPLGTLGGDFSRTEKTVKKTEAEFWTTTQRLRAAHTAQLQAAVQGTGHGTNPLQTPPGTTPTPHAHAGGAAARHNTAALAQIQNSMTALMSRIPLDRVRNYNIRQAVQGASAFVANLVYTTQTNVAGSSV